MISRFFPRLVVLGMLLALVACGKRPGGVQQLSADALYERGQAALQRRDWTDAIELFERFTIQFPTHPRSTEARFRLGEAYFGRKEYITAATEFTRLANDYPAGPYADDARFKVCESYNRLSPKPPLDQQYTRSAIDWCQSMLTYYPDSDFAERARTIITGLRTKLAEKEFLTGEFYFRRKAYDPGLISYESVAQNYADTAFAPRALLRMHETYQILGYKEEADSAKERLLKDYPTSAEAKQLQGPTASTGS